MTTCMVWCSISVICCLFARLKELPVEQFPCMQHSKEAALCALPLGNQHSSQSVTLRRRIPFFWSEWQAGHHFYFQNFNVCMLLTVAPTTPSFLCFTQARPLESLKHCFHSSRRSSLLNILKNLQLETKILHLVCFFCLRRLLGIMLINFCGRAPWHWETLFPVQAADHISCGACRREGDLLRTNSTWWPNISVWFFKVWKT